ncbi:isopropylmalate isomerase [uncultured Jannaschia sp.]|uniref:isopropylmalate isomerase n=1 Tax=uncultured Jannaschia sp. TaxID=293347 RepID=UPI00261FA2A3|nr:isopropylmalate isomerase [uncultured Jannaschia sp.]
MTDAIPQILDCVFESWSPGIGDPGVAGWLTVVAYLVAAVLSRALAVTQDRQGLERTFWAVAGVGLLFLAINKQLDLQSFLTVTGRCAAKLQGWYDMRRTVQIDFIAGLIAAAVLGGIGVFWILRRTIRRTGVALFGLVWITGFVLVRAVGFHDVDRLIGVRLAGMRLNWVFELGGISVFIVGCVLALSAKRQTKSGY